MSIVLPARRKSFGTTAWSLHLVLVLALAENSQKWEDAFTECGLKSAREIVETNLSRCGWETISWAAANCLLVARAAALEEKKPPTLHFAGVQTTAIMQFVDNVNNAVRESKMPAVNWTIMGVQEATVKLAQDIRGEQFYHAYALTGQQIGDYVQYGVAQDLSQLVGRDPALDWSSFIPFYREAAAVFNGRIVSIPVQGLSILLYYRRDLFSEAGLQPPRTWEEAIAIAQHFNGTDLDGDGNPNDYGICMWQSLDCYDNGLPVFAILASLVQAKGHWSGLYFNKDTLTSVINTCAWEKAVDLTARLSRFAAPPVMNRSANMDCVYMSLFGKGRCAMAIATATQFKQDSSLPAGTSASLSRLPSSVRGKIGAAILPGSNVVLDWGLDALVPCTAERCPYATLYEVPKSGITATAWTAAVDDSAIGPASNTTTSMWINHAPFASAVGFIALINDKYSAEERLATYYTLSHALRLDRSWTLIASPASGGGPTRIQHLESSNHHEWLRYGYHPDDLRDFLAAVSASLQSKNVATSMRSAGADNITRVGYSTAVLIMNKTVPAPTIAARTRALYMSLQNNSNLPNVHASYKASIISIPAQQEAFPSSPPSASAKAGRQGGSRTAAIVSSLLGAAALTAAVAGLIWVYRRSRRQRFGIITPPVVSPETTMCVTDIQDSTVLWERLNATVMDAALRLHNNCIRRCTMLYGGYESATEGDSFILAFHTPQQALLFCLRAQEELPGLDWPEQLLQEEVCRPVLASDFLGSRSDINPMYSSGRNTSNRHTRALSSRRETKAGDAYPAYDTMAQMQSEHSFRRLAESRMGPQSPSLLLTAPVLTTAASPSPKGRDGCHPDSVIPSKFSLTERTLSIAEAAAHASQHAEDHPSPAIGAAATADVGGDGTELNGDNFTVQAVTLASITSGLGLGLPLTGRPWASSVEQSRPASAPCCHLGPAAVASRAAAWGPNHANRFQKQPAFTQVTADTEEEEKTRAAGTASQASSKCEAGGGPILPFIGTVQAASALRPLGAAGAPSGGGLKEGPEAAQRRRGGGSDGVKVTATVQQVFKVMVGGEKNDGDGIGQLTSHAMLPTRITQHSTVPTSTMAQRHCLPLRFSLDLGPGHEAAAAPEMSNTATRKFPAAASAIRTSSLPRQRALRTYPCLSEVSPPSIANSTTAGSEVQVLSDSDTQRVDDGRDQPSVGSTMSTTGLHANQKESTAMTWQDDNAVESEGPGEAPLSVQNCLSYRHESLMTGSMQPRDLPAEGVEDGGGVATGKQARRRLLFRGLRVRMGCSSGVSSESEVSYNSRMARVIYTGRPIAAAKAVANAAQGGMVLVGESTHALLTSSVVGISSRFEGAAVVSGVGRKAGRESPNVLLLQHPTQLRLDSVFRGSKDTGSDSESHSKPQPVVLWYGGCAVLDELLPSLEFYQAATPGQVPRWALLPPPTARIVQRPLAFGIQAAPIGRVAVAVVAVANAHAVATFTEGSSDGTSLWQHCAALLWHEAARLCLRHGGFLATRRAAVVGLHPEVLSKPPGKSVRGAAQLLLTAAFPDATAAVLWSTSVIEGCLRLPWPVALLHSVFGEPLWLQERPCSAAADNSESSPAAGTTQRIPRPLQRAGSGRENDSKFSISGRLFKWAVRPQSLGAHASPVSTVGSRVGLVRSSGGGSLLGFKSTSATAAAFAKGSGVTVGSHLPAKRNTKANDVVLGHKGEASSPLYTQGLARSPEQGRQPPRLHVSAAGESQAVRCPASRFRQVVPYVDASSQQQAVIRTWDGQQGPNVCGPGESFCSSIAETPKPTPERTRFGLTSSRGDLHGMGRSIHVDNKPTSSGVMGAQLQSVATAVLQVPSVQPQQVVQLRASEGQMESLCDPLWDEGFTTVEKQQRGATRPTMPAAAHSHASLLAEDKDDEADPLMLMGTSCPSEIMSAAPMPPQSSASRQDGDSTIITFGGCITAAGYIAGPTESATSQNFPITPINRNDAGSWAPLSRCGPTSTAAGGDDAPSRSLAAHQCREVTTADIFSITSLAAAAAVELPAQDELHHRLLCRGLRLRAGVAWGNASMEVMCSTGSPQYQGPTPTSAILLALEAPLSQVQVSKAVEAELNNKDMLAYMASAKTQSCGQLGDVMDALTNTSEQVQQDQEKQQQLLFTSSMCEITGGGYVPHGVAGKELLGTSHDESLFSRVVVKNEEDGEGEVGGLQKHGLSVMAAAGKRYLFAGLQRR